jgi:hypothetical protein
MQAFIEEINQVLSLRSGQMETRLTLSLPAGERVTAVISTEDLATVTEAMNGREAATVEKDGPPEVEFNEQVDIDLEEGVQWAMLPDEELPPFMKVELANAGVPDVIPLQQLLEYVAQISAMYEEPDEKPQASPQSAQSAQAAPATPVIGRVVTNQGQPRRTVPMDEKGYPVVPGMEASDPGEVPFDGDDDGVPSL